MVLNTPRVVTEIGLNDRSVESDPLIHARTRLPSLKPNFTSEPSIFPLFSLIAKRRRSGGEAVVINATGGERIAERALGSRVTDGSKRSYESYLWENEQQSYLRHAVLFVFFVKLNRMYTDTVQKLPTNSESNIMRCSSVPRFKYLPISAPALSSRGTTAKTSIPTSSDDISSRST